MLAEAFSGEQAAGLQNLFEALVQDCLGLPCRRKTTATKESASCEGWDAKRGRVSPFTRIYFHSIFTVITLSRLSELPDPVVAMRERIAAQRQS
jgi:hypothetical protein